MKKIILSLAMVSFLWSCTSTQNVTSTKNEVDVTIDLVNVFRNSEDVPPVVDEAIAIQAPAVWLQLGISNATAIEKAKDAGLLTVQNKCLKIEWRRYS